HFRGRLDHGSGVFRSSAELKFELEPNGLYSGLFGDCRHLSLSVDFSSKHHVPLWRGQSLAQAISRGGPRKARAAAGTSVRRVEQGGLPADTVMRDVSRLLRGQGERKG